MYTDRSDPHLLFYRISSKTRDQRTLLDLSISDKVSYHQALLYFLKRNERYSTFTRTISLKFSASHDINLKKKSKYVFMILEATNSILRHITCESRAHCFSENTRELDDGILSELLTSRKVNDVLLKVT